jgi:hypothetical protein
MWPAHAFKLGISMHHHALAGPLAGIVSFTLLPAALVAYYYFLERIWLCARIGWPCALHLEVLSAESLRLAGSAPYKKNIQLEAFLSGLI